MEENAMKPHQRLVTQENDTGMTLVFQLRPNYCPRDYADEFVGDRHAYRLVAHVDTAELDEAFALTNHNETTWFDNPSVQCVCRRARSTSVGDVLIVPEGTTYLCRGSGWSQVNFTV